MLLRTIFLLALVVVCSATSCIKQDAIAVTPNGADSLTTRNAAFTVEETVSRQFGLTPYAYPDRSTLGFTACFGHDPVSRGLLVCGKTKEQEVQFLLTQTSGRFTQHADSLRRALLDSLRGRFGEHAVRECTWRVDDDASQSGCSPLTAPNR